MKCVCLIYFVSADTKEEYRCSQKKEKEKEKKRSITSVEWAGVLKSKEYHISAVCFSYRYGYRFSSVLFFGEHFSSSHFFFSSIFIFTRHYLRSLSFFRSYSLIWISFHRAHTFLFLWIWLLNHKKRFKVQLFTNDSLMLIWKHIVMKNNP